MCFEPKGPVFGQWQVYQVFQELHWQGLARMDRSKDQLILWAFSLVLQVGVHFEGGVFFLNGIYIFFQSRMFIYGRKLSTRTDKLAVITIGIGRQHVLAKEGANS